MFNFLAKLKKEFQYRKEMGILKKMGIIVKEKSTVDVIFRQLNANHHRYKETKAICSKVQQLLNNLKIALPLQIQSICNSKLFDDHDSVMYKVDSKTFLRINSNVNFLEQFEIGFSTDEGRKFTCISANNRRTLRRILASGIYQHETIRNGDYEWTSISKEQKISIELSETMEKSLSDFKELSNDLIATNMDFEKIVWIIKRYTKMEDKCRNLCAIISKKENVSLNDKYENYVDDKKILKIQSGKVICCDSTEIDYCFKQEENEDWKINSSNKFSIRNEKNEKVDFWGSCGIKIRFFNKNTYVLEVIADIKLKDDKDDYNVLKDDFGVMETIQSAEGKIKEFLGENDPMVTLFNYKTTGYSIEYNRGKRWKFETTKISKDNSKPKFRSSIIFTPESGWKVFISKTL